MSGERSILCLRFVGVAVAVAAERGSLDESTWPTAVAGRHSRGWRVTVGGRRRRGACREGNCSVPLDHGSLTVPKHRRVALTGSMITLWDVLLGFHPDAMDAAAGEPLRPKSRESDARGE